MKENRKNFPHIGLKYSLMQMLYWTAICSMGGFAAIFLSSKGLINTQIGTATGGAYLLSIFASSVLGSLVSRFHKVPLQAFIAGGMGLNALLYLACAYVPMPAYILIALYMLASCLGLALVPLISQVCMNLCEEGAPINFGLARGMGSIAYASSAVLFSALSTAFDASILAACFAAASAGFLVVLFTTPATCAKVLGGKSATLLQTIGRYRTLFAILVGFALVFGCSSALSVYLINIIHNLGGSDSLFGIAVFCMAASELPLMAAAPALIRRFGCEKLMGMAAIAYIFRNLLITGSPILGGLLLGMMLQGISYGLMTAVITYYISQRLDLKDQVMGQTLLAMMTTGVGSTLGSFVGGWVIDNLSLQALFALSDGATILGALIIVAAVLPAFLPRRTRISAGSRI